MEVAYLTRTENNLLRQVAYQGQRDDKSARQQGAFQTAPGNMEVCSR